jgi:pimeloyl-ACP methyl ester carboxylesterase
MRRSHLRAEVWENAQRKEIVVSFGGTDSKNDWKSNLRWFTFKVDDEYTLLVKGFSPAFIDEMEKRAQHQDHEWLLHSKLISTGHSLGGGLAQQFAYALPTRNAHIKVAQVYAFDPSPVTGFFSVDKALRDKNRQGLLIDRIYERGEILALLRSFTSMFVKPAAVDPRIRGVRYSLLSQGNAITYHSMHDFACHLQKAAGMGVADLL